MSKYFVLSLDGGGVKGVLEAVLIQRLEQYTGFLSKVDLFSGTSTGGILALALAHGVPVEECVSIYTEHASTIFAARDLIDRIGGADEYFRADFAQDGLRKVLAEVFGTTRLPELKREVLVPTFDLVRFKPKLLDRSDDWSLVDAALATSAAPTYFPVHVVREDYTGRATARGSVRAFVDGGMYANNPSDRAVSFARQHLGVEEERMILLSVGAGSVPGMPIQELLDEGRNALDWGIRQWIVKKPHWLLKVLFDGSVAAAHFATAASLGQRYHRLQAALPCEVDLADAGKVSLLRSVGESYDLEEELAWLRRSMPEESL